MTNNYPPRHLIVYADDDPDDLQLVKEALEQYSHHVEVATFPNGKEALLFLEELPTHFTSPCLIILDISMPVLSGTETLVELRNHDRYCSVPVVLFTTSSQPKDKQFAKDNGAGFITKPLGALQLEVIADRFIDHCIEKVRNQIRDFIS
jgi:CheY-like chemotaxis protein